MRWTILICRGGRGLTLLLSLLLVFARASPGWAADVRMVFPPPPEQEVLRRHEPQPEQNTPACTDSCHVDSEETSLVLAGSSRITLAGELRVRIEAADRPEFGLSTQLDKAILQRLLLSADVQVSDRLRGFVQIGSFIGSRSGGEGPTDVSTLDLAQAFIELGARNGKGGPMLRIGRQEVALGSSRLISVRESPNIRRSFDGFRGRLSAGGLQFDAFWLRPIKLQKGVFDDVSDTSEAVFGLFGNLALMSAERASLDIYWIGFKRQHAQFQTGTGREVRHSFGARIYGTSGGWDWDVEPVVQVGRFGIGRIVAWTIASNIGHSWRQRPLAPRLGLKADIASGDGNPNDKVLHTFNALYPRLPYFTEAGLAVPSNIMDLHPTVSVKPGKGLDVSVGVNFMWRHRRADAVYVPPLRPLLAPTDSSRFVGTQFEANAGWSPAPGLALKLSYVHFDAGGAIRAAGARPSNFVASSIGYRF